MLPKTDWYFDILMMTMMRNTPHCCAECNSSTAPLNTTTAFDCSVRGGEGAGGGGTVMEGCVNEFHSGRNHCQSVLICWIVVDDWLAIAPWLTTLCDVLCVCIDFTIFIACPQVWFDIVAHLNSLPLCLLHMHKRHEIEVPSVGRYIEFVWLLTHHSYMYLPEDDVKNLNVAIKKRHPPKKKKNLSPTTFALNQADTRVLIN